MQPAARAALGWLFDLIGDQAGARQGWWSVALGPEQSGIFNALAIRGIDGFQQAFVSLWISTSERVSPVSLVVSGTLRMEHGLLTVDLFDLMKTPDTTGALVHVDGDLASYYTEGEVPGSKIPESVPERYRVIFSRLVSDSRLTPPTDLPDGPPLLERSVHAGLAGYGVAALWYLVTAGSSGGVEQWIHPSRYTGPARALVQAWVGAGLREYAIRARLPPDWSIAPGALGLTRDTVSGDWWVLQIGISGLQGCRLTWTGEGRTLQEWIDKGQLDTKGTELALPYVLAGLTQASTPVALVSPDKMAAIYSGQGTTEGGEERVWVGSGVPDGSKIVVVEGDQWKFESVDPPPHNGGACHVSKNLPGFHQHYFYDATTKLVLAPGETLFCWIRIPSDAPPAEIMLSFRVGTSWEHRAYWGSNLINAGTDGTASRMRIGGIPAARDEWVALVVDPWYLDLEEAEINGVAYSLYNGWAAWDDLGALTAYRWYGEGDAWSVSNGWAWNSSGTKGTIVLHREVSPGTFRAALESARSEVRLVFQAGKSPEVTLSPGAWKMYRPYFFRHKFWWGYPANLAPLRCGLIWPGNADCAEIAPIVAWYDPDGSEGTLKVVSYYKTTVYTPASKANQSYVCSCSGAGDAVEYSGSGLTLVRGGYGLTRPEDTIGGSGKITYRRSEMTTGNWGNWGGWDGALGDDWLDWWGYGDSYGGCGAGAGASQADQAPSTPEGAENLGTGYQIRFQTGTARGEITTETVSGALSLQIVVSLFDCPGVLWERQWVGADSWSVTNRTYTRQLPTGAGQRKIKGWRWPSGQLEYWFGPVHEAQPLHCFGGPEVSNSEFSIVTTGSEAEEYSSSWAGDVTCEATCRIVGTEHEVDCSGWAALGGSGVDEVTQAALYAYESAGGAAWWIGSPNGEWRSTEWDGPRPAVLGSGRGYAFAWVGAS